MYLSAAAKVEQHIEFFQELQIYCVLYIFLPTIYVKVLTSILSYKNVKNNTINEFDE